MSSLSKIIKKKQVDIVVKLFDQNFAIVKADTEELRKECFALRHQIFCVDRGFDLESVGGHETDAYDAHALCFLIQHVPTSCFVGTGRLILASTNKPKESLPIQKYLSEEAIAMYGLDKDEIIKQTCEISRLGILRAYIDPEHPAYEKSVGISNRILRNQLPNLYKLGLCRAVLDFALNHAHTPNCVFATDPLLLRSFVRAGFRDYVVMGENFDNFGKVTPVYFNIPKILARGYDEESIKESISWAIATDNGRILADFAAGDEGYAGAA